MPKGCSPASLQQFLGCRLLGHRPLDPQLLGHGLLGPRLRVRQLLAVVLLSGLAVWGTLHSPTIFFDNQILLGGSLGVLALLQFGWLGLPVGLASALTTVALWGHPWGALILVLQLLWQQLFLWRFNGGPKQRGNGRIVLATIAFWLVVGLPLKTLLYTTLLQADLQSAVALGFKEAVVGVVNAGLGLLLYLALQLALMQRRRRVELSLRGLVFAVLLLLISLPGVLIITVMGQQITDQAFRQFRANLEQQAQAIAVALPMGSGEILLADAPLRQRFPELAFEARAAGGQQLSSDPRLFARLGQEYRSEQSGPLEDRHLSLLVPGLPQSHSEPAFSDLNPAQGQHPLDVVGQLPQASPNRAVAAAPEQLWPPADFVYITMVRRNETTGAPIRLV